MGRIGQALARRAAGFAMPVIYHNRTRLSEGLETECRARYVTREALFTESDHLVLVVPYTADNHHLVGAEALTRMKPTATLTNIARGGLVDEDALADALEAGRLAAAGLDVYEGEPTINPRLLAVPNVALTPHLGSASRATRGAMGMLAIDNLFSVLRGDDPPNRVG